MPGTMSQADLVEDLRGMLKDAADKFEGEGNEALERILNFAALDLGRVRPRIKLGSITAESGKTEYVAPIDFVRMSALLWGYEQRVNKKPWDFDWPDGIPSLSFVELDSGSVLLFSFAPTANQVVSFGSDCKFTYYAGHSIDAVEANTTVKPQDRHLLLIRAVAQSLLELALNGISKPVQLGSGVGAMPKNGTPGALADQALELFERMAA